MTLTPARLTELEVASGLVLGPDPATPALRLPEEPLHPVRALELAVLPALLRPPCLVSFSGGRDSSVVLAVSARLARREGLDLPVPVTFRYPTAPETNESEWQEMIVRRLALPEWRCRDVGDELDLLGPVAQRVLLRHGVLYPPNVHIQALRFEEAAGGTFLTGHGGDQVLGAWPWGRLWAVLRGRSRPRRGDGRLLLGALAPPKLRARVLRGRGAGPALPWTRPNARSALARAWAADQGSIPRRWDAWAAWVARRRNLSLSTTAVAALAREAGVDVRHPLIDRSFLGALAVHAGRSGFPSRTAAMEALFSDLLPPSLLTRRHKAHFAGVLWAAHSRAFIGRWDGEGIPDGVVDRDALRRVWGGSPPHFGTAMLLQRAWLTSIGGRDGEEPLYGGVE